MDPLLPSGILVEAEAFDDYGGWVLDSQFELTMGSPYLLAHGNGVAVADASTRISIPETGAYRVWVRAKDWVPQHHPGRFQVLINGFALDVEFGANNEDWNWEFGGTVKLASGDLRLTLHDLTGFCGRCDAIFLSRDSASPPNAVNELSRRWRKRLRGLPEHPEMIGEFDVVVVGGGFVGAAAALTAARLGDRVALVQDRPVLGGNSSVEIGLSPRGEHGMLVKELMQRHANGDLVAQQLLEAEPTATVILNHTVFGAATVSTENGVRIVSVDARDARSGYEIRLAAPIFIDCSGKALFGTYAGAETLFGQEAQAEYGESLAPLQGDNMHHGNTVFFRTGTADSPVSFPSVPWATEVSRDYANLGGQLITPGFENGPGPKVGEYVVDEKVHPRMNKSLTHYWEYGQWLDPYTQAEHIRDYLLRAIYGTFSNVKTLAPEENANLQFEWVAFVPGQGEFRRYKGPHVLCEPDVRSHRVFEDAIVKNGAAFCLHYPFPRNTKYDFRLQDWIWDERDGKPFDIPFRCLYSANISNLMMAGKHISVTHVAGSCSKYLSGREIVKADHVVAKLMGNGAQHAIATAAAAHLCKKHSSVPAGIYEQHLPELKRLVAVLTRNPQQQLSRL
jgi:hypothetical protein